MRAAAAAVFLTAGVARAQLPALAEADAAVAKLQFAPAAKALERAEAAVGNDRPTVLRIYALQGIVWASLNRGEAAVEAFKKLLVLDPEHQLARSYAPRVMTPYYEARGWVAGHPAMTLEQGSVNRDQGLVTRVSVLLSADPLNLGRAIRFHLRAAGAPWQTLDVPLDANRSAVVEPRFASGSFWAQLLGPREAVLLELGDEAHPFALEAVREAPRLSTSEPLPASPGEPAASLAAAPAPSSPRLRPLAWGALAAGVAAGGAGAYFAVASQSARQQFSAAERGPDGVVTGITQRQAQQLDATARTDAAVGNACFIAAGVLAAASITAFVIGSTLRVAAAPTGVSVSGELP